MSAIKKARLPQHLHCWYVDLFLNIQGISAVTHSISCFTLFIYTRSKSHHSYPEIFAAKESHQNLIQTALGRQTRATPANASQRHGRHLRVLNVSTLTHTASLEVSWKGKSDTGGEHVKKMLQLTVGPHEVGICGCLAVRLRFMNWFMNNDTNFSMSLSTSPGGGEQQRQKPANHQQQTHKVRR